jgi:hypothetical protein
MNQWTERRVSLLILALLAVTSVAVSILVVTPKPYIDDFFIGTRYATNWVQGNGIVYNPGEPVEGYTAFGWVALLALALRLGMSDLLLLQIVGVCSQIGSLVLVYAMGRGAGRSPLRSLFAPALLAFQLSFVVYPMMGMSTSWFAVTLTLAVYLTGKGAVDTLRGSLGLGAVLLVLALIRFDGAGLALGLLLYPLLVERKLKASLPALLVLLSGLVVYNVWRIGYYGQLLPNTFYAKQLPYSTELELGLRYVRRFVLLGGPWVLVLVAAPIAAWPRGSRMAKVAIWMCGGHLVYTIAVGGDWMPSFRFMLYVVPLYAFLMQEGLWRLADTAVERGRPARAVTGGALVVMALLFAQNLSGIVRSKWWGGVAHRPGPFWHCEQAMAIGDYLDETLPPDTLVAVEWAGVMPSRMRQPILDILGLNDIDIIARDDFLPSNIGRLPTAEYVAGRSPELVAVVGRTWSTVDEARTGIDARPASNIKNMYERLRTPELGYQVCVVKIGDGYWPCLVRSGSEVLEGLCLVG